MSPRKAAFDVILSVLEGNKWLNKRLTAVLSEFSNHRDRIFIANLVYGTVKNAIYLDWVIKSHLRGWRMEELDPEVRTALLLGAYQILKTRIPAHAAVNETVNLVKKRNPGGAKLINALLRKLTTNVPEPPMDWIKYSIPRWLYKILKNTKRDDWLKEFIKHYHSAPPVYVRVNTLSISVGEFIKYLDRIGTDYRKPGFPDECISLSRHPWEFKMPEHFYYIQDLSTQTLSYLVSPKPGERILDLTAAPGGKASHMATLMKNQGIVIAVDINSSRVKIMKNLFQRLGIEIGHPVIADARNIAFKIQFDRVLLDVPCSGLGTLRRKPEVLYRMTPERVHELVRLQRQILDNAVNLVKPSGALIYATCTVLEDENEKQIDWFLSKHKNFRLLPAYDIVPKTMTSGYYFYLNGSKSNSDYAFAAILQRVK